MAYIEERKSSEGKTTYRVQVRVKGCEPVTATFERKTDAKLWAQQTEASIREGRYFKVAEAKKHTLGDVIDRYLRDVLPRKKRADVWQMHQFLWWKEKLGYRLLADLSPALIAEHRDLLASEITVRKTKRSPATVVRYMAALSHALSIAVREWGWLDDSPMRKVTKPREPRGRVRFLDQDERKRLLNACEESQCEYLYLIVILALGTGARQGEILNLKWSDVELEKGRLTFHETKNGERRSVPLSGYALDLLRQHAAKHTSTSSLLFPSKRLIHKAIDIRSAWENVIKKAELKDFKFHDLRHSAASELAMSGASLAEISAILGHRCITLVKRYSHLSDSHIAGVLERMNEKVFKEI